MASAKKPADQPEQTADIRKTYDTIRSAAGADIKPRGERYELRFFLNLRYTHMVEAIASGIEDKLIDGLSFKMNTVASYVIDRRSVTFHPQGSNIYKTKEGTKLIRIC